MVIHSLTVTPVRAFDRAIIIFLQLFARTGLWPLSIGARSGAALRAVLIALDSSLKAKHPPQERGERP